jgi:hypothetical protein
VYPGTDGIIITPLMEFIRNKKAMKQKLVWNQAPSICHHSPIILAEARSR